jgi:four helix bundle protein
MSNIAEGFERGGVIEFRRYLVMAKGSCAELRSQMYVAFDQRYVDEQTFESIQASAVEVGRMTAGFIRHLEHRTGAVR